MRRLFSILLLMGGGLGAIAQANLVPNHSFDLYTWCPPGGRGSIVHSPNWISPWINVSTDFHHLCGGRQDEIDRNGFQLPRSGQGMGAIAIYVAENYMEYLVVELDHELRYNEVYVVSYFLNIADHSFFTCANCFEAKLVDSLFAVGEDYTAVAPYPGGADIRQGGPILDSIGWTQICDTFRAQGGEQYLIIGSFVPYDSLSLFDFVEELGSLQYWHYIYAFVDDISVRAVPSSLLGRRRDTTICSASLPFLMTGRADFDTYQWTGPQIDSSQSLMVSEAGVYLLTQTLDCASVTDTFVVAVDTLYPAPNLGPDRYHCEADMIQAVQLDAGTQANYSWSTGGTSAQIEVETPGSYSVQIFYDQCPTQADTVELLGCPPNYEWTLQLPNVFTPNGDGIHDFFVPMRVENVAWQELHIYDRWGRLMYRSASPFPGWDGRLNGKIMPSGVYTYNLRFSLPVTGEQQRMQGTLSLLR